MAKKTSKKKAVGARPKAAKKVSKVKKKASAAKTATKAVRPKKGKPAPRAPLSPPELIPPLKQKSGLTKRDIAMLRNALLDKRAELVGDMTRMRDEALSKNRQDAAGNLSNMPIHMADIGTDNYEQEFTLGLLDNERAILHEIDEALARIDKGTYGVCLATGAPIGLARLKAQPWAKYSYEYMLQRERQRGGRY